MAAENHSKVLQRMRPVLRRQLSPIGVERLIGYNELCYHFSAAEIERMRAQALPSEQIVQLLDTLSFKDATAFEHFVSAVREVLPDLAVQLESERKKGRGGSSASSPMSSGSSSPPCDFMLEGEGGERQQSAHVVANGGPHPHMMSEELEDAGVNGLDGHGPRPAYHLQHMSYNSRQFLSSQLNHIPAPKFQTFCVALGGDERMVKASLRSQDRTAYFLQEFSRSSPDATYEKLEQALNHIGYRSLMDQLQYY